MARALQGDPASVRLLVEGLGPTIEKHVVRGLYRRRASARRRELVQEVDDMVQEVFASLFEQGGRALRAWRPAKGLPLAKFVGLLAEHQVSSILRSGRRSPWTEDATDADAMAERAGADKGHEERIAARSMGDAIVQRLRGELSPLGIQVFQLLFVCEMSVEEVCEAMTMRPDAVYTWRSRIGKRAREIVLELERTTPPGPAAGHARAMPESR